MGKSSKKKHSAVLPQPQSPAPSLPGSVTPPAIQPKTQNAVPIERANVSIHPFELLLRGARESGLKEGLEAGTREKEELLKRVIELEVSLKGLRAKFSVAQERGAAIIAKALSASGAENQKLSLALEEANEHNLRLEEQLAKEENRPITEVAAAKGAGQHGGYNKGRDDDCARLEQQAAPSTIPVPESANTTPPAHTSSSSSRIHFHHPDSVRARSNPWSSIARRHKRHSRTRTHRCRTEFISKTSIINPSQYIIPPRRTSSIPNPNIASSPHHTPSLFLDIISNSLSFPSSLFRGFGLLGRDEGVATSSGGTCGSAGGYSERIRI